MNFVCDLSVCFLTWTSRKRGWGSIRLANTPTHFMLGFIWRAGTLILMTCSKQGRCLANASSQRLVQSSWSKVWARPGPRSCGNSWRTMGVRWRRLSPHTPPTSSWGRPLASQEYPIFSRSNPSLKVSWFCVLTGSVRV